MEAAIKSTAAPEPTRLETLPREIIHVIAIHCDADAALALGRVSKSMHQICYSWLVFKSIASSLAFRIPPGRDVPRESLAGREPFRFSELSSALGNRTESWARYAVALTRVTDLEENLPTTYKRGQRTSTSTKRMEQYLLYMPQLSCLGYTPRRPICATIDFIEGTVHASRAQGRLSPRFSIFGVRLPCAAALQPSLSFCFAIEILRGDLRHRANLIYKETGQFLDPRGVTLNSLLEELVPMVVASTASQAFWRRGGSYTFVAAFAYFLLLRDGEPHPFYRPPVKPPAIDKLPLLDLGLCPFSPHRTDPFSMPAPDPSYLHFPPPPPRDADQTTPSPSPSSSPSTSSTPSLALDPPSSPPSSTILEATKTLIETSTWTGYYAWASGLSRLAAPMENISFTLPNPTPTTPASCPLAGANGFDSVGHFDIHGHIDLGAPVEKPFVLRKVYSGADGPTWVWEGFLTAFGFVGVWRRDVEGATPYGVFWLWRADWAGGGVW